MGEMMMMKFDKYWDEYSTILAFGAVLDPRIKFTSLTYCYSTTNESTCEEKIQDVRRKLYMLFERYSNPRNTNNDASFHNLHPRPQTTSCMSKQLKGINQRMFGELKMHNSQLASKVGKSQLDVYLDKPNLDFVYYEELDVLQWWRDNYNRFSELFIMARDVLSIPITTVASKSAFSIGSHVINKYRNRLLSENVEALICTRSWLHGFAENAEDGDDDICALNMDPTVSKGSNTTAVEDA